MKSFENDIKEILLTKEDIQGLVKKLAREVEDYYRDSGKELVFIGILKGCIIFLSDLVREVDLPLSMDFMAVSSYGMGKRESTGVVKILKDLDHDIADKDVLIVEDIVDSGLTLSYLIDLMKRRGANSIKICSLLSKPSNRKKVVDIDFLGVEIPNEFIVGYGLDYSEKYRNLPYIATMKEEAYQ